MSVEPSQSTPSPSPKQNKELLDNIFRTAEASVDWRKGAFEAARIQIHSYFLSSEFNITEHGPVFMPIMLLGNVRLPPEDTLLVEIRNLSNNTLKAVALIANADPVLAGPGNENLVFGPIIDTLNQLLRSWRQQGKLEATTGVFAIVLVRSKITFLCMEKTQG